MPGLSPDRRAAGRRHRNRRGRIVVLLALVAVVVAVIAVGFRYVPLIDDVRNVREASLRLADEARSLEPADLNRASVERIRSGLDELDDRLVPVRAVLDGDLLVELARRVPAAAIQVQAADDLVDAADSLVEAGQIGLDLADRVVMLREANDADPEFPLLPGLVELMADSDEDVDRVAALLASAADRLNEIPDEAIGQIREARDMVAEPLDAYAPLLESYRDLDGVLPGLLGWGGDKRYLVLAQNPAELRPTGGYTGTIGTVVLRDGAIVEQRFEDTYFLSVQEGLPFIEPPQALADFLLGDDQSWRLADANWSPDFPTAARKAAEFYRIETGQGEVDGVIAITTYALDRLLEVVGPVQVPEYGVTVKPGDVTLTLLGATRGTPTSIEGRKDILDALARETTRRLLALPPDRWADVLSALEDIAERRDVMVWFDDAEVQQLAEDAGWTGRVRQDAGDYVYVVEANVAPTSKYNLVIDRSDQLIVTLNEEGDALNRLRLDWQNDAGRTGEPYESLREFSINQDGWYGSYVRVLTPVDSELVGARGQAFDQIRDAEREEPEAGRAVFANDLLIPPGEARLTYRWKVPNAAVQTDDGWLYELVVQKQPGARPMPLSVQVDLPEGAVVSEVSEGAVVDGQQVRLETEMASDVELRVLYDLPAAAAG